jgi:uncharacterized membrane protein
VGLTNVLAMRDWLVIATNTAVTIIDWLALILIVVGAIEAFFRGLRTMFASPDGHHERDVWLRLGRWLVAGLTFQLAADVLETAVTTSWDEVARLAAIAAIRTFLNYFLERDLGEVRERQGEPSGGPDAPTS